MCPLYDLFSVLNVSSSDPNLFEKEFALHRSGTTESDPKFLTKTESKRKEEESKRNRTEKKLKPKTNNDNNSRQLLYDSSPSATNDSSQSITNDSSLSNLTMTHSCKILHLTLGKEAQSNITYNAKFQMHHWREFPR